MLATHSIFFALQNTKSRPILQTIHVPLCLLFLLMTLHFQHGRNFSRYLGGLETFAHSCPETSSFFWPGWSIPCLFSLSGSCSSECVSTVSPVQRALNWALETLWSRRPTPLRWECSGVVSRKLIWHLSCRSHSGRGGAVDDFRLVYRVPSKC